MVEDRLSKSAGKMDASVCDRLSKSKDQIDADSKDVEESKQKICLPCVSSQQWDRGTEVEINQADKCGEKASETIRKFHVEESQAAADMVENTKAKCRESLLHRREGKGQRYYPHWRAQEGAG